MLTLLLFFVAGVNVVVVVDVVAAQHLPPRDFQKKSIYIFNSLSNFLPLEPERKNK